MAKYSGPFVASSPRDVKLFLRATVAIPTSVATRGVPMRPPAWPGPPQEDLQLRLSVAREAELKRMYGLANGSSVATTTRLPA